MQKEAAKKLIRDTLEKPFNKEQFSVFIKNLLNHLESAPFPRPRTGQMIFADFRSHISSLDRVGKYTDSEGRKLDVLIVKLSKTTSLERARSKLRNFVAKYLKESQGGQYKEAALVAFVSPNEKDWRFSFVKMEYKFDTTKQGSPKIKEEFTPAKRYSFLVGEHENSHTAQTSLLPILENSDNDPSLLDLENAFSIETVTKEFFEKYRGLFLEIKESLDKIVQKDKAIKADFEEKGVDTVDFSKKLLGQIVFLYFLQKKGWFGVARNEAWGTGPKNFLKLLFEGKMSSYDNFFNDILEPLFYEALAVERQADYYSPFKCKVPFLNGGLFDPLNDYDWVHTDILIPDELFSNKTKTKQGDIGTGILDVFDRYNFTVKEDEPLEKEVAVDPEMLGKVFENLLEVKDRKSKGTYYTPREIVHYMCQESLINYLTTELEEQVEREDIETLIKHGETALENDALVSDKGVEKGKYKYKLPKSIREHNELIDRKLAEIKVCDPAVGSGAFLVGMMSEIVKTRSVLARLINPNEEVNVYDFKRDAIQDSLHGVDIDLGAVEIAKLRLWLSLIVDEENYKHIKPLPNLDYKIMQGNSLLEEYEGIKLIDERFFEKHEEKEQILKRLKKQQNKLSRDYIEFHKNNKLTTVKKAELNKLLKEVEKQIKAFDKPQNDNQDDFGFYGERETQSKADKLLELHERFFSVHHKSEKDRIHKKIDELTWDLIETTIRKKGKESKLEDVKKFQRTNTSPFFLWKLNFADVFREKNGFDIVIANPPYIFSRGNLSDSDKKVYKKNYSLTQFKINLYILFIEKSYNLISNNGLFAFIIPNNWLTLSTTSDLRYFILDKTRNIRLVFNYESVFENASVDTCLLFFGKNGDPSLSTYKWTEDSIVNINKQHTKHYINNRNHIISNINAQDSIIGQICGKINSQSILLSSIAEVRNGVQAYTVGEGKPIQTKTMKENRVYHSLEKKGEDWIKYLDGVDVKRYKCDWSNQYIKYGKNLSRSRKAELFNGDRLLVRQIPAKPPYSIHCCYITENAINDNNSMIIKVTDNQSNIKYLQCLLNSRLISFWFIHTFGKLQRTTFPQFKIKELRIFPIKPISLVDQEKFVEYVNKMNNYTNENSYLNNSQLSVKIKSLNFLIDQLVYKLYDLTPEEIAIVENSSNVITKSNFKF